ncbi:hypothetical protein FTUN_0639 [Frigoriglobus tundricola]|uniref:Uncharacterized protein n=1 Tax=Frigoriglobus tundricola TaxID=2774151 RepID=A0A6M5YIN7_9BACT|nr:hypothetical protein FTUN_0639 [Frigoriglobus tundricola]
MTAREPVTPAAGRRARKRPVPRPVRGRGASEITDVRTRWRWDARRGPTTDDHPVGFVA